MILHGLTNDSLRYVVMYGTSGLVGRLDQLDAPPHPKCIGRGVAALSLLEPWHLVVWHAEQYGLEMMLNSLAQK